MAFVSMSLAQVGKGIISPVTDMELTEEGELRELAASAKADFEQGRYDEALKKYLKIFETKKNPKAHFSIGQCYRNLGKIEEAIKAFRKYLEEVPSPPNRKDVEILIKELVSELEHKNTTLRYEEAKKDYQSGHYQAALDKFSRIIGLSNLSIHYDIALCYEKLGKKKEAIEEYQLYLQEEKPTDEKRKAVEARIAALKNPLVEPEETEPEPEAAPTPAPSSPPRDIFVLNTPDEASSKSSRKKVVGYSLAVVGGLALGGSVWSYLRALDKNKQHAARINELVEQDQIDGEPGNYRFASEEAKRRFKPELDDLREGMVQDQRIAVAALAGGLALVATGTVLLVLDSKGNTKVSVDIEGPTQAKLQLRYQF